jgi:hypothetical protein
VPADIHDLEEFRKGYERLRDSGASGDDGGMPPDDLRQRVVALEGKVDTLVTDSREIKTTLVTIRDYLSELRGKVSQLPTWWQTLLGIIAIAGLVFAIAKAMR